MKNTRLILLIWSLLVASAAVQAQFDYATNADGTSVTITRYTGSSSAVVIPSTLDDLPVTSIGEGAFYMSVSLTSVTIGSEVTSIGTSAFYGCANLTSVVIPDSVTSIEVYAFSGCGLTGLTIPDSVNTVGDQCFSACYNLAAVTIPGSIHNIGKAVFSGDSGLTSVTILDGVASIGQYAFSSCFDLTNITIPNSITSIGGSAFALCSSLPSVTISDSVTNIGSYAFAQCGDLATIYFQGNAPGADSTVFSYDAVTAYYLPGTIGWGSTFANLPTALWTLPCPLILTGNSGFNVQSNGFGFTVSWATNLSIAVEVCTNLANPIWQALQTNALTDTTSGGWFYFNDPDWTNYSSRFYRLRTP